MHIGNNYSTKEVLFWTRKDIYLLLVISSIPVVLYQIFDLKWIAIPWLPVALLGTAVAFMVGFKNNAAYDRTWEARKIWGAIVNFSRTWGLMVKDYISNKHAEHKLSEAELHQIRLELTNRHLLGWQHCVINFVKQNHGKGFTRNIMLNSKVRDFLFMNRKAKWRIHCAPIYLLVS